MHLYFDHCSIADTLSQGNVDWNGADSLSLNVTDGGNVGTGGALFTTGRVPITVLPVNDPPKIALDQNGNGLLPGGGALGTDEDVPLSLELLSVDDAEMSAGGAGRLTVSLQSLNGGFALVFDEAAGDEDDAARGVVWAVGGVARGAGSGPWQAVVFSGGLAETNRVLTKLEYVPGSDWHGVDDMTVSKAVHRSFKYEKCVSVQVYN